MSIDVIFFDWDGVGNSHVWWQKRGPERRAFEERHGITGGVDPEAAARLLRLADETGAWLVISSTIRRGRTLTQLREAFGLYGVKLPLRGATPYLGGRPRGHEIDAWIRACPYEIRRFVILDDDSDMEPHLERLVKTTVAEGLLDEHVARARAMLK